MQEAVEFFDPVSLTANGRQHLPALAALRSPGPVLFGPGGVEEDAVFTADTSQGNPEASFVLVVFDLRDVLNERFQERVLQFFICLPTANFDMSVGLAEGKARPDLVRSDLALRR